MNDSINDIEKTKDSNFTLLYEFLDSCTKIKKISQGAYRNVIIANLNDCMNYINKLFVEFEIAFKYIGSINEISDFKIDANIIFQKFTLLEEAIKIPDYVLIGDILKYEIDVVVEQWEEDVIKTFKICKN